MPSPAAEIDVLTRPAAGAKRRAAVTALKLTGYRNYESLALPLAGRSVVLTGPNGAGKTNLLEAVSLLSPGRGIRGARLDEIAMKGGNGTFAVAARVANSAGEVDLGTGVVAGPEGPESRRRVHVNHAPAGSSEAFLDHLRVLWLTPAMDGLFTGPPADRRRYLDRAVLSIDKAHGARANAFERAMRGRNRLLAEPSPDPFWLDAIETEMAELGVAIAAARREWAALAVAMIDVAGRHTPFPTAEVALSGTLEGDLDGFAAREVEERYRRLLREDRERDAVAGRTLVGPHRSDLLVRHGPKDMPAESCSTGEQKALLVGLVLAQARLVANLAGETPVILLDEIAAHLDESRREALFDVLDDLGAQTFMTGTDESVFAPLGGSAQRGHARDGRIELEPA
ncbi:MAG TPA: DNA replication/repair protein RecF [Bauldia sp.]|nr:DNA replication/repair protein RecF [Bauldia sp.]